MGHFKPSYFSPLRPTLTLSLVVVILSGPVGCNRKPSDTTERQTTTLNEAPKPSTLNNETKVIEIAKPVEVSKTNSSVANASLTNASEVSNPFKIDWSKIDPKPSVPINNTPKPTRFYGDVLSLAQSSNITPAEAYRRLTISASLNEYGLLDKIKYQLKDRFVDLYWHHGPEYQLVIVTRQNVAAETHEYVFTKGQAKGFSVPIVILPIADRSKEDMVAVYDNNDNYKKVLEILKRYGGEPQGIGYTPEGFKIVADVYYPNEKLTEDNKRQLESDLKQATGVTFEVREGGELRLAEQASH